MAASLFAEAGPVFWATGRLTPIRNGRLQTGILRYIR
jgi:hypothetical protein